ncbi:MAG: radical SAM protein [Candidatus Anstonellales archaeon]
MEEVNAQAIETSNKRARKKAGIIVEINRLCNLSCLFCNVPNENLRLDIDKFKQRIDGYRKVGISGGEPILHPDLRDMLMLCKNKENIVLATNLTKMPAYLLNDHELENNGVYKKLYIQINLPSLNNELYKHITNANISLDVVLSNIEKLLSKGRNVIINVVLTSINAKDHEIMLFIDYFQRKPIYMLRFHPVIIMDKGKEYLMPEHVDELYKILEKCLLHGKGKGINIVFPSRYDIKLMIEGKTNYDYITLEGLIFPSLFHAWLGNEL